MTRRSEAEPREFNLSGFWAVPLTQFLSDRIMLRLTFLINPLSHFSKGFQGP